LSEFKPLLMKDPSTITETTTNIDIDINYDDTFKKHLPDSLGYNHYELAELYGGTPKEWRTYLRDNQTFIDSETASLAEPAARAALTRLKDASGTEVAALKAILESSKLINEAQKQQTKVLITFIPPHTLIKEEQNDDNGTIHPESV
jgi:hypothetical protein